VLTHFFIDILTFLGSVPCVIKGKWKNGNREKQKVLRVFFPFSPLSPFSLEGVYTNPFGCAEDKSLILHLRILGCRSTTYLSINGECEV
jgi:hypothetical protein